MATQLRGTWWMTLSPARACLGAVVLGALCAPPARGQGQIPDIGPLDFRTPAVFRTSPADWREVQPLGLAVGDLNNDGWPDVVAVNTLEHTLSVFLNTQNWQNPSDPPVNGLATPVQYSLAIDPREAAIGDVDNDGDPDIVVSHNNFTPGDVGVSILRNISHSGSFSPPIPYDRDDSRVRVNNLHGVVVGDWDANTRADVALGGNINNGGASLVVFWGEGLDGQGRPSFTQAQYDAPPTQGTCIGFDVVTAMFRNYLGPGYFGDIVMSDPKCAYVHVYLTVIGQRDFTITNQDAAPSRGITASAFDAGSSIDLAIADDSEDEARWLANNGFGTFVINDDEYAIAPFASLYGIAAGRLSLDAANDIVLPEYKRDAISPQRRGRIAVLLGLGNGSFVQQPVYFLVDPQADGSDAHPWPHPQQVAVGDLNFDTYLDVLTTNFDGASISVLINDSQNVQP